MTVRAPPIFFALMMPCVIVFSGFDCVPGLVSLPFAPETKVPSPLQLSSAPPAQLLSFASPQISGLPGNTVGSLSSQSPAHVVTPSPSLSGQPESIVLLPSGEVEPSTAGGVPPSGSGG